MSYKTANRAYSNSKKRENFTHDTSSSAQFNELIKKTYKEKGAFGYICVQSPDSDKEISNWEQDPDLECSWAFVSPNLLTRGEDGLATNQVDQAVETHNIKHYVLSQDTLAGGNFTGALTVNTAGAIASATGGKTWTEFKTAA